MARRWTGAGALINQTAWSGEAAMKFFVRAAVVVAGLGVTAAVAQPAANEVDAHLAAAKAAAGFDFTGTLARVCVAPQTGPGAHVAPPPPPDPASWITRPPKGLA